MEPDLKTSVANRVRDLLDHLGIERAHFGAKMAHDWEGIVRSNLELIESLTLLCPVGDVGLVGALQHLLTPRIAGDAHTVRDHR